MVHYSCGYQAKSHMLSFLGQNSVRLKRKSLTIGLAPYEKVFYSTVDSSFCAFKIFLSPIFKDIAQFL